MATKRRLMKRVELKDWVGDVVVIEPGRSMVELWCQSEHPADDRHEPEYTHAWLSVAQARRVARALLRFADGAK